MTGLPSGTVTLVFSDIEGSTRLLQDLGETYEQVLTDHRQLLSSRFEEHDGVVVDMQGDAFFVAFARAQDAVLGAVEAQRALAAHEWPGQRALRARMAIHTGEPTRVGRGFVGLAVHRAARICAAGHGGQILISSTTRDLVQDNLPSGVVAIDLGEHRLKDLDRTEAIAQLVVEGVPPVLTPLKSFESQPAEATPFAGREEELAESAELALGRLPYEEKPGHTLWSAAQAWALDWKRIVHVPGHTLAWHRAESLGLSMQVTARIAPRRDVQAELHRIGTIFVLTARDARGAADLLEHKTTLERRLAQYRKRGVWETQLRAADMLAKQIGALTTLANAIHEFEKLARTLEPRLHSIRTRVFDARHDPAKLDELASEIPSIREAVEGVHGKLHAAYRSAREAAPRVALSERP
jgi:class 3 adenylate cyclase